MTVYDHLVIVHADDLSRAERNTLIAQYRAEGWKSVHIVEAKHRAGTEFKTAYEVRLSEKRP